MAKTATSAEHMDAAALASEACDQGFQEGVQKMVEVLLQGWVIAQSDTEKKQAVQRFKTGIGIYKGAYLSAKEAIGEVFSNV
jgi:hypothetical protein